jgi:ABC-type transporter MlaC component
MRYRCVLTGLIISAALAFLAAPSISQASTPAKDLESAIGALQQALKNKNDTGAYDAAIRDILSEHVDFAKMSRRMLRDRDNDFWSEFPHHRERFMELFREILIGLLMKHADRFKDTPVEYRQEADGFSYGQVEATITVDRNDHSPQIVVFRMVKATDRWKVWDVTLGGVFSIVSNYGSQFRAMIRRTSFDALLRAMEQKQLAH